MKVQFSNVEAYRNNQSISSMSFGKNEVDPGPYAYLLHMRNTKKILNQAVINNNQKTAEEAKTELTRLKIALSKCDPFERLAAALRFLHCKN